MAKEVAKNYIMKAQLYQLISTLILVLLISSCVATDVAPRKELTIVGRKRILSHLQYPYNKKMEKASKLFKIFSSLCGKINK